MRRNTVRPTFEPLEIRTLLAISWLTAPVIPQIDAGMAAHLQAVYQFGLSRGNRPDIFSKVGDSITASPEFLSELGFSAYDPTDPSLMGNYTNLAGVINYFRSFQVDGFGADSFNHISWAAISGWRTADLLDPRHSLDPNRAGIALPTETPLETELRLTHPSFALIMIGTNDLGFQESVNLYRAQLTEVGKEALAYGVIPVFSTLPPMLIGGPQIPTLVTGYNQVITEVGATLGVPVWNYGLAMQSLPGFGISADGVHPNAYPGGNEVFTPEALGYGFNERNLTALQVLDKLKRMVVEGAPADGVAGSPPPAPQFVPYIDGLYRAALGRAAGPSELALWSGILGAGGSRVQVATAVWHSAEHYRLEVNQFYASLMHRSPHAGEAEYWVGQLLVGVSEVDVERAFLRSAEYQSGHASAQAFVQGLYQDVLGRSPSVNEQAYWVGRLGTGLQRDQLAQQFLNSAEGYKHDVDQFYATFLGRSPIGNEEDGWIAKLIVSRLALADVGEQILSSDEFFARAS